MGDATKGVEGCPSFPFSKKAGCRGRWPWLTCRFIDEFGRTFVRRGFQYNWRVLPLLPPRRDIVAALSTTRKLPKGRRRRRIVDIWYCNGTSSIGNQPGLFLAWRAGIRTFREFSYPLTLRPATVFAELSWLPFRGKRLDPSRRNSMISVLRVVSTHFFL